MKLILTILALFTLSQGQAQLDSGFVWLRSFEGDIASVAIDNLDNLYVISSTGQIRKYDNKGDSVAIYNQVRNFGKLSSLDISNPLKPVLFYQDFSTVVILDRLLSQRTVLDLRRYTIYEPSSVALSYDDHLWVFDEFDNKLKKIDDQGNILMTTPDFRVVFNQSIRPSRIINETGYLYLADSTNGIYIFDNYGTFRKKLPLVKWQSLTVKGNSVIYSTPSGIIRQSSSNYLESKLPFPKEFQPYSYSYINPERFIIFSKDNLKIYRY